MASFIQDWQSFNLLPSESSYSLRSALCYSAFVEMLLILVCWDMFCKNRFEEGPLDLWIFVVIFSSYDCHNDFQLVTARFKILNLYISFRYIYACPLLFWKLLGSVMLKNIKFNLQYDKNEVQLNILQSLLCAELVESILFCFGIGPVFY